MSCDTIVRAIFECLDLPEPERIAIYNEAQAALRGLIRDVSEDPACTPQLVPAELVVGNEYNPNRVASTELDLLEESIRADGITMAIVVMPDELRRQWVVIDGFHRRVVATERLGRRYLPVVVIERELPDRMASTVRHNRARGKHQVDLMAALIRGMVTLGWDDERMATALGMSPEELLRLRQMVGVARVLAADEYSCSWGNITPDDVESEDE